MVQDRWPSQDKVDPNTSVNGNLDTLHEAIVVNNVKSLFVEKNLTNLFVTVDKFPFCLIYAIFLYQSLLHV